MIQMKAIASGSNGNCIFVSDGQTNILIDCGISCKRIVSAVSELVGSPEAISAILLTHEHSDHTQGLKIFTKKYQVPVYGSDGTICMILQSLLSDADTVPPMMPIHKKEFEIGTLHVQAIRTSHDAADPFAYRITSGDNSVAVFTDCGTFNDDMIQALKDLDGILLESNYEIPMLECGPYPYPLKRRILGPMGHLSNDMAAEVLKAIYSPKLKLVVGGHLSGENNYPEVARLSLENAVKELGAENQIRVEIAKRTEPTELFTLG